MLIRFCVAFTSLVVFGFVVVFVVVVGVMMLALVVVAGPVGNCTVPVTVQVFVTSLISTVPISPPLATAMVQVISQVSAKPESMSQLKASPVKISPVSVAVCSLPRRVFTLLMSVCAHSGLILR